MDSQKTDAFKLTESQKTDAYKLTDSQKPDACKLTDSHKTRHGSKRAVSFGAAPFTSEAAIKNQRELPRLHSSSRCALKRVFSAPPSASFGS